MVLSSILKVETSEETLNHSASFSISFSQYFLVAINGPKEIEAFVNELIAVAEKLNK